jgi:hypothetical protein
MYNCLYPEWNLILFHHVASLTRYPVVSVGVIRWVECTVTEPSYFKLSTEHTPVHIALLDEIVANHHLLHHIVLELLILLFESKQDELEILVQVCVCSFSYVFIYMLATFGLMAFWS